MSLCFFCFPSFTANPPREPCCQDRLSYKQAVVKSFAILMSSKPTVGAVGDDAFHVGYSSELHSPQGANPDVPVPLVDETDGKTHAMDLGGAGGDQGATGAGDVIG